MKRRRCTESLHGMVRFDEQCEHHSCKALMNRVAMRQNLVSEAFRSMWPGCHWARPRFCCYWWHGVGGERQLVRIAYFIMPVNREQPRELRRRYPNFAVWPEERRSEDPSTGATTSTVGTNTGTTAVQQLRFLVSALGAAKSSRRKTRGSLLSG